MRAPVPSEPNYTFPTYQVPQVSAMRGRAPPVQVARTARGGRAEPPSLSPFVRSNVQSVISGSSCPSGNSNLRMQSVTDNCLLNSVTVPKIQRNVAHNNSVKLAYKSGALILLGQDIPGNQKAENKLPPGLTTTQYLLQQDATSTATPSILSSSSCYSLDRLIELSRRTRELQRTGALLPAMKLLGGGESSINTGTSGWGTPPSQQANNNNANTSSGWGSANPANQNNSGTQQWNNNANRLPNSGPGSTNQDANKANTNLPPNGQQAATSQGNAGGGWGQPGGPKPPVSSVGGGPPVSSNSNNTANPNQSNNPPPLPPPQILPPPANSTKAQLEQLTNMREAIFSQDGWGGQHVNQDTNWDIPGSPEPTMKMDGSGGTQAPPWKPNVNNGTELWEANLRNGGQPPPQPQAKTPWGHTPSTNIGGTWGEDDDVADSSNVWTGVPSGQQQQWGGNNGNSQGGGGNNGGVGGGNGGGGAGGNGGNGGGNGGGGGGGGGGMWGGPKKENDWSGSANNAGGWGDPRAPDPRGAPSGMDPRDMRPDPRDMRAGSSDPMRMLDPREQNMRLVGGDMRGDPRGITGRLNGTAEAFWGQTGPQAPGHHMGHHQSKMPVGGPGGNGGAGWEEPSPPSQRRNMPNYDDGTSLWGNPQQGGGGGTAGMAGRGGVGPPGMPGGPGPAGGRGGIKPPGPGEGGNSLWRNGGGSWDEPGPVVGAGWNAGGEDPGPWPKQKPMGGGGPLWAGDDMDAGGWNHKPGPKPPLTKEMVWNSKQFRMLVDMGYKKDDVENALRMREMNMEDALDMLGALRPNMDGWRTGNGGGRHDDHYDQHGQQGFPNQRGFPSGGPSNPMNFPPGSTTPNLLNNMNSSSGGGNNPIINNMSPANLHKMLAHGGGSQGFGGNGGGGGRSVQPQSQPSTAQLRMLVQQIQMAVQAGYLNHQILNQPLAPQTLVLLNQLLQQIKTLQQWAGQQSMAQSQCMGSKPSNALLQCSVYITKTKQEITNLQNQIAAQQAIYVKRQQHLGGSNDFLKSSNPMHESINALQTNFGDIGMKDPQVNQQQSRLNQWKLPALDKDEDFSRAPGSVSKPLVPSHSSPNLNPLGLTQPDGPWSSGRNNAGDTGWPETAAVGDVGGSDIKDTQWPAPSQPSLTDLVPEFEPGKPWKGNQKNIEDDPSITPGSVVRSPLSLTTIKDTELFNMNPSKSPPAGDNTIQPLSLSSSTWSFNPPSSTTSSAFTSPQNKIPSSKGGLGDLNPPTAVTSELWGAPKRGPPPGLTAKGNSAINGWGSNIAASAAPWGAQRSHFGSSSQWLLLRNLTTQIDGSTLRTLCMQHGPLQSFHLHLPQHFALARYSTREEAVKAQTALHNCVLGNTTIVAENPSDWEASALLQEAAGQQAAGWRGGSAPKQPQHTPADTWSNTGWSTPASNLWGSTALDSSDQSRATPSSLNSFLPGDLLGGESM